MEIRTISAEIALSKSFQKYTVGMVANIWENEDEEEKIRELQAKCRKLAMEQIKIDEVR